MGKKKGKKVDPAKELAKKQRKARKQERCADKRSAKADRDEDDVDIAALIAAQRERDAARKEVTVTKLAPPAAGIFAPFSPRCASGVELVRIFWQQFLDRRRETALSFRLIQF